MEENAAFAEKFDFPYPLLCDTTRAVGLMYGACESADAEYPKRITYVIDPNGKISQIHGKVDASLHPNELLHTL